MEVLHEGGCIAFAVDRVDENVSSAFRGERVRVWPALFVGGGGTALIELESIRKKRVQSKQYADISPRDQLKITLRRRFGWPALWEVVCTAGGLSMSG